MSTKLTYTGAEVQELLDKIEKGDFDNAKTLEGHPASYFAIASEFTSLAESFATEQGRISALYSYFNNGSANNALKLGGQLPTYYATATQYEILQRTLSDFKSLFDSMFEKDSDGNIHAKLSLWSSGGITAGGVGSGGSGGGGGVSYNRLDSWSDYSADKAGYVLSALLGKDLDNRVSALANAGYVTASALAPYALRSELPIITKDGLKSTLGISDWALASVKPTYTASEVGALGLDGGTVTGEFIVNGQPIVTKAGNATIIFSPNNREQNYWFGVDISGSLFITDNGYNKVRTIIHEDNIGHYKAGDAGNSDKLGWVEASKYFKGDSTNITSNINADNLLNNACYLNQTGNGSGNENFPHSYSIFNVFANGSDSRVAQVSISNDGLAIRRKIDSWGKWRHYINTANIGNYNAGSATKLQTPRTIWGQSFDGTGNVGGDLYVHQLKIELGNEINSYNYNFNTANGDIHLNYRSSGPVTLAKGGGNVAIGGVAADEKLYVYGNGKFTGALTANSLTIGGATITYDSVNEALCINGNMYALGGVTAGGTGISTYSSLEARVARLEQQLNI